MKLYTTKTMMIEVRIESVPDGKYVAQACVRAKPGHRYDRHAQTGGRCGTTPHARTSAKQAIRLAVLNLGRRLK